MAQYVVTDAELSAVANAIRTKGGTSGDLEWTSGYIAAIRAISGGAADGYYWRVRYYSRSGSALIHTEYVEDGGDCAYALAGEGWAVSAGGGAVSGITQCITGNLDLYFTEPYTPLEYIESTGTQWLSTEYIPTTNSRFVMDLLLTAPSNTYDTPFGARGSQDVFVAYNGGTYRFIWAGVNQNAANIAPYYGQRVQMILENESCRLEQNGTVLVNKTFAATAVSASLATPMGLFTLQTGANSNLGSCNTKIRVYRFSIYESGALVREFIPVRDANNVACMYETKTGTYAYNKGTGAFTAQ